MKNIFALFLFLSLTMNIFPIIRGTRWGMSKQKVMILEKRRRYLPRNYKKSHTSIWYRFVKVGGEEPDLTYDFINNKLILCSYSYHECNPSKEYFNKVMSHLVGKYGKKVDGVFSQVFLKKLFFRWSKLTLSPKKDIKIMKTDNHWSNKYTVSYTTFISQKYDTLVVIGYVHHPSSTALCYIHFTKYSAIKKYHDSIQPFIKKRTPKNSSIKESF